MKLVADIGNSRIKWSEVDEGPWRAGQSASLDGDVPALLDRHWRALARPERILIANVAGERMAEALRTWSRSRWALEPEFFRPSKRFGGITNAYRDSQQLGSDRWAAILGARSLAPTGPLCVVDCGTAITVDALTGENRFIGGVIFPGVDLIQRSLLAGTAGIRERRSVYKQVFGTTTAECVSGGSYLGTAGAIDRVLSEMRKALGRAMLYITGGDAPSLSPLLEHTLEHEPDLVLLGLARALT